jgi:hypothetical protein
MNASDAVVGTVPPPAGVTPNFANPESIAYRVIITAALWPAFILPIVSLRLYTSGFILRKWHADDALIVVGYLFAIANSIICGMQTHNGVGNHIWEVRLADFRQFMKLGAIGGSLSYNLSTLFTKVSILHFYLRFSIKPALRTMTYFVMFVAAGYSAANGFVFLYLCKPMEYFWDPTISKGTCVDGNTAFMASAILNVVTDLAILMLPVWILWPLHVGLAKKISVALIMMAGGFVCAVSIVRLVFLKSGGNRLDFTWDYVTNIVWCLVEMYTGILCACLPYFRAFAKHCFPNATIFHDDRKNCLISETEESRRQDPLASISSARSNFDDQHGRQ